MKENQTTHFYLDLNSFSLYTQFCLTMLQIPVVRALEVEFIEPRPVYIQIWKWQENYTYLLEWQYKMSRGRYAGRPVVRSISFKPSLHEVDMQKG